MPSRDRPTMFIGSSAEGLLIAQAIQVEMDRECEVEIWHQGAFGLMGGTLESLVIASERFDFATFVVVPNDTTTSRRKKLETTRDNVIFELGLFIGAIGRGRTFMVYDRSNRPDLPTDLAGVTPATFETHRSGNLVAAVGAACTTIKTVVARLGTRRTNSQALQAYASRPPQTLKEELHGVKEAWFAWHAGSVKLAQGDLLHSSRSLRVLLTKPGSKALTELGKVVNLNGAQMSKDVRALTKLLVAAGHQVAWLDGFIGSSLIIANPTSKDAWARVEALVAFAAPAQRPSVVLKKAANPDSFAVVVESFKKLWALSERQK